MSEQTLGEFLRQEREKSGITIEQVASATKISVRVLHAIEGDHFSELPARPFIRGFVGSYARFVGLDSKEVLVQFDHYIQQRCEEREQGKTKAEAEVFDRQDSERSRTTLWAIMGFFVVAAGIVLVVIKQPLKHKKMSNLEKLKATTSVVEEKKPVVVPPPTEPQKPAPKGDQKAEQKPETKKEDTPLVAAAPEAPKVEEVKEEKKEEATEEQKKDPLNKGDELKPADVKEKILLRTAENVWVRYRVDNKPVMKFMLLAEKQLLLKGREAIRLQVSKPEAVKFRYQWGPYESFGGSKLATHHNSTSTVIVPKQLTETAGEPFPGEPPLPAPSSP